VRQFVLISLLALAAGCGSAKPAATAVTSPGATSSVTPATSPSRRPATSTTPTVTATTARAKTTPASITGQAKTVTVSEADNGHVLTIRRGDGVKAVLHSTYWTFAKPSNAAVLLSEGDPVVAPQRQGCVPGQGCGTVTARYLAGSVGQAFISAHRDTCGEAMACAPNQRDWRVKFVVTG
jgi:hypothetical protein